MFKACGILVAAGLLMVACASSSEDGVGAPDQTEPEATESVSQAITYVGYCAIDAVTNLTTGKCRVCSNLCKQVTDSECPVGAPAINPIHIPQGTGCIGGTHFDSERRCTNNC